MAPVSVRILHPEPGTGAGPLTRRLADARSRVAERHRRGFLAAGAADVAIESGPPDDRSFGDRLRRLVERTGTPGGLIVLGSGAIPLATAADRRAFVAVAASDDRPPSPTTDIRPMSSRSRCRVTARDPRPARRQRPAALARGGRRLSRGRPAATLAAVVRPRRSARPGAARSVCSRAGRRGRPTGHGGGGPPRGRPCDRGRPPRGAAGRRSDLGRDAGLARAPCRGAGPGLGRGTRAPGIVAPRSDRRHPRRGPRPRRPRPPGRAPVSLLGLALDRDGPGSLGEQLARFADAAIIDSRVLLAHRLGGDEAHWPSAEDRFASDLLLADAVADPWLRELTASAVAAPIPILLGGHTLVGPGVRLVVDGPPRGARWT